MKKIALASGAAVINLLEAGEQAGSQEATAMAIDDESQCPKCGDPMGTGVIAGNEQVYYCEKCRVSHPFVLS